MKTTTKTTIILVGVFLIGLVIGAFSATSYSRYAHRKRLEEFRTSRGFFDEMVRLINMKPEQRSEVEEILRRHAEWGRKFGEEQHEKFIKGMDSLKTELTSVLSTEQIKELEQKLERIRNRRPHPGPGQRAPKPEFDRFDEKMPPPPPPPPSHHGEHHEKPPKHHRPGDSHKDAG